MSALVTGSRGKSEAGVKPVSPPPINQAFPKSELARRPADREKIMILAAEIEARAGKPSLTQ